MADLYSSTVYPAFPRNDGAAQRAADNSPNSSNGHASGDDNAEDIAQQFPGGQMGKVDSKPQATFLTKLYMLLERPENHHMIRWDAQGTHIVVERPEQLALHVLPSIYRQSRFASFSRQLNIYGFMRKVNLRSVDASIEDPDASTWSHPTLTRTSTPETVANFKRRVPPRLPKSKKKETAQHAAGTAIPPPPPPPRSAENPIIAPSPPTIVVPPGNSEPQRASMSSARARGFSAPGPSSNASWMPTYPRPSITPLTVPESRVPPPQSDLSPSPSTNFNGNAYPASRDLYTSGNAFPESGTSWQYSPGGNVPGSHSGGSLSSLLNPGYASRPSPTINTSYTPSFTSMSLDHASSISPDSRPNTGYSMSSVSSMHSYEENPYHDYSRPSSSHQNPSPQGPRPTSSHRNSYGAMPALSSGGVRRNRRHSQAVNPYPIAPDQQRPSTSPAYPEEVIPRTRSMIQLPFVDNFEPQNYPHDAPAIDTGNRYHNQDQYNHRPATTHGDGYRSNILMDEGYHRSSTGHGHIYHRPSPTLETFGSNGDQFAYTAPGIDNASAPNDPMDGQRGWSSRGGRPSTSNSSISHNSSSQANTPPILENYAQETGIHQFGSEFDFVPMASGPQSAMDYTKVVHPGEMQCR